MRLKIRGLSSAYSACPVLQLMGDACEYFEFLTILFSFMRVELFGFQRTNRIFERRTKLRKSRRARRPGITRSLSESAERVIRGFWKDRLVAD